MKRNFLVFAVLAVLAVTLLLRRIEKRMEAPTLPQQVEAPAPAQPPAQPDQPPSIVAPPPVQQAPLPTQQELKAREQQAVVADIDGYLQRARQIAGKPDLQKALADCLVDPARTAQRHGLQLPPGSPVLLEVNELLCTGDLNRCDRVVAAGQASSSGKCPNPPCSTILAFGEQEFMEGTADGCKRWASSLFYLRSAVAGAAQAGDCKALLREGSAAASDDQTCTLLAQDLRAGTDSLCRSIAAKDLGPTYTYDQCFSLIAPGQGEAGCAKIKVPSSTDPSCRLRARLRAAVIAKSPAPCKGENVCVAALGQCEKSRPLGLTGAEVDRFCRGAVPMEWHSWIQETDAHAQHVLDRLNSYKDRLGTLPDGDRKRLEGQIASATTALKGALKDLEKLRGLMNQGKLPTAVP